MSDEAPRRRWPRIAGLALAALLLPALAAGFAVLNRPQLIRIDFGFWTWRGEAIHALFAAGFLGLLAMFLLGLPADLRARGERDRLARRLRAVERQLESGHAAAASGGVPSSGDEPSREAPEP